MGRSPTELGPRPHHAPYVIPWLSKETNRGSIPRRKEIPIEQMIEMPPWVALFTGATVYMVLKFVLPSQLHGPLFSGLTQIIASWAKWVALFFLVVAGLSALLHHRKGALFERQKDIESIRGLSWLRLETLIGEAYRREGYSITENAGPGSDGGVDIVARRDGETVLVQCKQWKARKVGVQTIREMFGLLDSEEANEIHVITSGSFTEEAKGFARNKPVKLIDGPALFQIVKMAQSLHSPVNIASDLPSVFCPKCGSDMVIRTAKKGSHVGERFWGCGKFPACKGIRPADDLVHPFSIYQ